MPGRGNAETMDSVSDARAASGPQTRGDAYIRFPHLHGDLLCFVAEDDLWLAPLAPPLRAGARRGGRGG
ncbi:hypothetical protein GCM10020000_47750 [Streptomyces olivoverticillatus]